MLHAVFEKWTGRGANGLALIGAVSIVLLMLLTVFGVFMRKVLSAPVVGMQEYSQILLVVTVFSFLAYSGWTGGQICIDIIDRFLGERASRLLGFAVNGSSAILMFLIGWQAFAAGIGVGVLGMSFNITEIPHAPFYHLVGFGFIAYALILAVMAWRCLAGLPEYPGK